MLHDRHHAGVLPDLVTARTTQRVGEAIAILQEYGISQLPVSEAPDGDALEAFVGWITERRACSTGRSATRRSSTGLSAR